MGSKWGRRAGHLPRFSPSHLSPFNPESVTDYTWHKPPHQEGGARLRRGARARHPLAERASAVAWRDDPRVRLCPSQRTWCIEEGGGGGGCEVARVGLDGTIVSESLARAGSGEYTKRGIQQKKKKHVQEEKKRLYHSCDVKGFPLRRGRPTSSEATNAAAPMPRTLMPRPVAAISAAAAALEDREGGISFRSYTSRGA